MTINSTQLQFILDNTPSDQNIMLVGKHGIGKSRILENYFSQKGQKVVTLFLGQMSDPGDLIGLPEKNQQTGKTDFMLPYWFPLDNEPVVLFLDELNRARPEVLQTIMDLTLNRKLAGKSLPKGSRIISAVNNGTEYQLTDLDPALVSRFNIYEFVPTVEDWLEWAKTENIDGRIISFITQNPEYLDSPENDFTKDNLAPTPDRRSWERLSAIIKKFDILDFEKAPVVSGVIGDSAASLFLKFTNENKIPSAKEILENFDNVKEQFENFSVSDFIQINSSVFNYLEYEFSKEHKILDKNYDFENRTAENLNRYFDFLEKSNKKEIQTQFVNLCNAEKFPNALVFIAEKCGSLYSKMIEAVNA